VPTRAAQKASALKPPARGVLARLGAPPPARRVVRWASGATRTRKAQARPRMTAAAAEEEEERLQKARQVTGMPARRAEAEAEVARPRAWMAEGEVVQGRARPVATMRDAQRLVAGDAGGLAPRTATFRRETRAPRARPLSRATSDKSPLPLPRRRFRTAGGPAARPSAQTAAWPGEAADRVPTAAWPAAEGARPRTSASREAEEVRRRRAAFREVAGARRRTAA
jgi:hypothetical protein